MLSRQVHACFLNYRKNYIKGYFKLSVIKLRLKYYYTLVSKKGFKLKPGIYLPIINHTYPTITFLCRNKES